MGPCKRCDPITTVTKQVVASEATAISNVPAVFYCVA